MSTRLSKEKREQVLQKWERSGLTVAEFCRRQGLCYATVARWRREANEEPHKPKRSSFVEVEVAADEQPKNVETTEDWEQGGTTLCAELSLPGGAVLRIYGSKRNRARA